MLIYNYLCNPLTAYDLMLLSAYLTDTVRKLKIWFVKSVGFVKMLANLPAYYNTTTTIHIPMVYS